MLDKSIINEEETKGNFGYIHNSSIKDLDMFNSNSDLRSIYIDGLNQNLSFKNCPDLNLESLEYLVHHAANINEIVISLNSSTYNNLITNGTDLIEKAKNKNIQFITE